VDNLTSNVPAGEWRDSVIPFRVRDDPETALKVLRMHEVDESSLRSQLAVCINEVIRERGLTQTVVSGIFGIPQPHISELRNYKLSRFSSERLVRFITLLDRDVDVIIRPKSGNHAEGMVSVMVVA
jgi:predicted XRE-type DNA-binding protein